MIGNTGISLELTLNGLLCADVTLRNYSLTHSLTPAYHRHTVTRYYTPPGEYLLH